MIVMPILSSYCQTIRHVMCIRNMALGIVELKYAEFESLSYIGILLFLLATDINSFVFVLLF